MNVKNLLRVTALAEGSMALAFLLLPSMPSQLLFGQTATTALAAILGHFVGAVLISLSLACWWAAGDASSKAASGVIKAVLFYDVVATVILVYAWFGLGAAGILLWVGVAVHVVLGLWCVIAIREKANWPVLPYNEG